MLAWLGSGNSLVKHLNTYRTALHQHTCASTASFTALPRRRSSAEKMAGCKRKAERC